MRNKHSSWLLVVVGLSTLLVAPAHAQLEFSLNPVTQTYEQGTTVSWNVSFTNVSSSALSFEGISFSSLGTDITSDDTAYFTNFDGSTLSAGEIRTGTLFSTTAALSTPVGTYGSGVVTVTYRTSGSPTTADASANLISIITANSSLVPEPASGLLLLMGSGLALYQRRRNQPRL